MALDREEMNKRRKEREALRRNAQEQQRKLLLRLCAAVLILVLCGIGIFLIVRGSQSQAGTEAQQTEEIAEPTRSHEQEPTTQIHIRAAGDLVVTDKVIQAGASSIGYDFTDCFMDVAATLTEADLTVLNFEGNLCGEPYNGTTTSAPNQLAQALRAAGVDILQAANSYTIENGLLGMTTTLGNMRSIGMEPIGAFSDPDEFARSRGYTICEVKGIKVAVVAFTKGMGSRGLPAGSEDCINLLYTDYATTYQDVDREGIKRILKNVEAEKPDITVALLHWGSEYNETISDSQKEIVRLMQNQGVDVILGTHPHLLQQIDYDELTGNLVAYSLGDFFGDGSRGGTNYSIILDVEITRDNETGVTRVTDYGYTPIYILSEEECVDGQRRVVRIHDSMRAYENNYVDKVTPEAYDGMKYALQRIGERIAGPKDTEEKK